MSPHDAFAERVVIGSCLAAGRVLPDIAELLSPQDFWTPTLTDTAEVLWDLTARGLPCDPVAVRTELLQRGVRSGAADGVFLVEVMQSALPTATHHARTLRDLSVRRQVIAEASRAVQQAENPTADPYDIAAQLSAQTLVLADRTTADRPPDIPSAHEFARGPIEFDWLVPDLLERGDRLMVTGGEGSGKSVLTRQTAVCVAAGLHPFTGDRIEPQRVLLVDLENGTRHLRRALRLLLAHAQQVGRPVPEQGLWVESRPSGVDLTTAEDEAWLTRICQEVQPALMVIGPLYRMHATDMAKEEPARHLTRTLDGIRARHGCSLVIETHAGHGAAGHVRDLRPVGSSLFRRWPEFGYGLRPKDGDPDAMQLIAWRGARDERRWPSELRRGTEGEWPWAPAFHRWAS
jgi:hypothetical protein